MLLFRDVTRYVKLRRARRALCSLSDIEDMNEAERGLAATWHVLRQERDALTARLHPDLQRLQELQAGRGWPLAQAGARRGVACQPPNRPLNTSAFPGHCKGESGAGNEVAEGELPFQETTRGFPEGSAGG